MSVPMRWQQPIEPQEAVQPPALPQRRQQSRRVRRSRVNGVLLVLMAACAAIAIGLRFTGVQAGQRNGLQLAQTQVRGTQVRLVDSSVERNLGFVTVTGNLHNLSARPLSHVEAVVELLDPQGGTVKMESALIGQDTLAAGENAPFRVEMEDNAHAVGYRVHFRKLLGSSLN
jgi:hypothetical protein